MKARKMKMGVSAQDVIEKKAKTKKETDKEETRGGGSFSLTVHHGPLMYEWCDENWFPSELFQALSLL